MPGKKHDIVLNDNDDMYDDLSGGFACRLPHLRVDGRRFTFDDHNFYFMQFMCCGTPFHKSLFAVTVLMFMLCILEAVRI